MAYTKEITHDAKIRGDYLVVCIERLKIKDGTKIVSNRLLSPKNYTPDSDWSAEDAKIKKICDTLFTDDIKIAWEAMSDSEKDFHR